MDALTTCPECSGFLDLHGCLTPWLCGILVCVKCGTEIDENTGKKFAPDRVLVRELKTP